MNSLKALVTGDSMAMPTLRNLPADLHRALRTQATLSGRSTEAEVCEILASAVKPEVRGCLGEALAAMSRDIGLTNEHFEVFDRIWEKVPAVPLGFNDRPRNQCRVRSDEARSASSRPGLAERAGCTDPLPA